MNAIFLYLFIGSIVNIYELIRGKIWHKNEYEEFKKDMAEFTIKEQLLMVVIYLIAWPVLIIINAIDIFKRFGIKK